MKRLSIVAVMFFLVQVSYANFAFYNKVETTCQAYRFNIQRSAMTYEGQQFSLELKSRSRSDFEMAMLVGFSAIGMAEVQQKQLQKANSKIVPMLPQMVQVTVLVPVERTPTIVTASASGELVEQLALGKISTQDFMQKIKDTLEIH